MHSGSADREYDFSDPKTGRQFLISYFDGDESFRVQEMVPNGRRFEREADGSPGRCWDEPLIKETELAAGPNQLMATLARLQIDADSMIFVPTSNSGGVGFDYGSLDECAREIANVLDGNRRYVGFRPLTAEEEVERARRDAASTKDYWSAMHAAQELANANEFGIFKGCHNMLGGALDDETKKKILSYINGPSQDAWLDVRGIYVVTNATLWNAWCQYDESAPRSGRVGYPDSDVIVQAIRAAVDRNIEQVKERLAQSEAEAGTQNRGPTSRPRTH